MYENEFIARQYNEGKDYKEIIEAFNFEFNKPITVEAVRSRIRRMRASGTIDFLRDDRDDNNNILNEIEKEAGGFFKVGVWDIETTGLWADFGYVLVSVIKDLDTNEYVVHRLDQCKSYNNPKTRQNPDFWRRVDKEVLEQIVKAYEQFDIIIHFNGRNFDHKFVNTRLIKNELPVLPEMKQLDIYQIAKHKLRLRSKRLDALREFLEIDKEADGHRWEYWQMAAAGVKEGFDFVVHHCCKDVDRLAEVARRMKAQINYIRK